MLSYFLRILILIVITLLYAVFDVFNKRDVPNLFVYASLLIGIAITLTYVANVIYVSLLIALAIGGMGYALYRAGLLGAGDFFEFATISLIFPFQPNPLASQLFQFNLPFVFSVFIATGYVSVLFIALYYLLFNKAREKNFRPSKESMIKGVVILSAYLFLILLVGFLVGVSAIAAVLILIIAVSSVVVLVYERLINARMVSFVYPRSLEEGDMIAINLMSRSQTNYFNSRSTHFGRLVTRALLSDIKRIKRKVPVYRNAAPLALFAFIGVVISLLFGNIMLYIVT